MNDYRAYVTIDYNSIYHHGIKGQKWGRRRYQNEDGSLTPEGRARYLNSDGTLNARGKRELYGIKNSAGIAAKGIVGAGAAAAIARGVHGVRSTSKELDMIPKLRKQYPDLRFNAYANKHINKADIEVPEGKFMNPEHWRQTYTRHRSNPEYIKAFDAIKKSNARKGKAIAAGILAAGIGTTALSLYINGRRKKNVEKRKGQIEKFLQTGTMDTKVKSDSKVTKKVKSDWNNMSDQEFMNKYSGSKATYAKRVAKYGDPYMNSPWAKLGKKINKKKK